MVNWHNFADSSYFSAINILHYSLLRKGEKKMGIENYGQASFNFWHSVLIINL